MPPPASRAHRAARSAPGTRLARSLHLLALAASSVASLAGCARSGDDLRVPASGSGAVLALLSAPLPRESPSVGPAAEADARHTSADKLLGGSNDGRWGYLLKLVDGPYLFRAGIDEPFEPASTLKTVHLLHALREVDAGAVTLESAIPWYRASTEPDDPSTPLEDERQWGCPIDAEPAVGELGEGLRLMMERSDNRWTQAIRRYFGDVEIQKTAKLAGMERTLIRHRIGCAEDTGSDPGASGAPDSSTLRELSGMLEGVEAGRLLSADSSSSFVELMANDTFIRLASILREENAPVGLPEEILAAIERRIGLAWKSGKYNIGDYKCQSVAGLARLPFYADRAVRTRSYVYAVFVDNALSFPEQGTRATLFSLAVASELLRDEMRGMLLSFRAALEELRPARPEPS